MLITSVGMYDSSMPVDARESVLKTPKQLPIPPGIS